MLVACQLQIWIRGEGVTEEYQRLLDLLMQAELAARNSQWPTCGTACRRAMELSFQYAQKEKNANS